MIATEEQDIVIGRLSDIFLKLTEARSQENGGESANTTGKAQNTETERKENQKKKPNVRDSAVNIRPCALTLRLPSLGRVPQAITIPGKAALY